MVAHTCIYGCTCIYMVVYTCIYGCIYIYMDVYTCIYGCICTIYMVNLEMPEGMTPFLRVNQVLSGEEIH